MGRETEYVKGLFKFLDQLMILYKEAKKKQPYHINIIDELHADENAHSRILAKLLQYKDGNKFPFLEKFIHNLCGFDIPTNNLEVGKVDSFGRIDLPIYNNKYFVIVENKVNGASDQINNDGGQLARYIENVNRNHKKELKNIFIVYTPRYNSTPTEETWKNKENYSYKNDFYDRFKVLSYKDSIYPWIKEDILPFIYKKDIYLQSAVEQYIDYLEGMFSLREIDKGVNMELQEYIKNKLDLDSCSTEEAINRLSEKEEAVNSVSNSVYQLKSYYKKKKYVDYFLEWQRKLNIDFPSLENVSYNINNEIENSDAYYIGLGKNINIKGNSIDAIIEYGSCEKQKIYFGLVCNSDSKNKEAFIEEFNEIFEKNNISNINDGNWYGWKETNINTAYDDLKQLITDIKETYKL